MVLNKVSQRASEQAFRSQHKESKIAQVLDTANKVKQERMQKLQTDLKLKEQKRQQLFNSNDSQAKSSEPAPRHDSATRIRSERRKRETKQLVADN